MEQADQMIEDSAVVAEQTDGKDSHPIQGLARRRDPSRSTNHDFQDPSMDALIWRSWEHSDQHLRLVDHALGAGGIFNDEINESTPTPMDITIILLTLASTAWSATTLCYWPDGQVAIGQFPCNAGGHSTCCGTGYACLSNNMCMAVTDAALIKGPLAAGYDVMGGQQVMHKCDNNDTLFYCESSVKPDCEHTKQVIVYSTTPTPQTTITASVQSLTATGTVTAAPGGVTPKTSNTPAGDASGNDSAKIGIGVGVTLGCLGLFAGLAALFIVKRRKGRGSGGKPGHYIPPQELPADAIPAAAMSASPPPPSPPPSFWPNDCKTPFTPSSIASPELLSPNRLELPGY
ncbi:transmembrane alpha-helix domain-containing protein [Purpureocillium lavendulum]|uniref:Transmembrane alpha-helix domain-containing protein n=1 Tax=Purpureocillium lavendulum TaxID=1247861 RepID=A0AB34FSC4_9HYPO|nr:transmembrane alpha-helix domain-containing protein [Purpureocillium lavendulum]